MEDDSARRWGGREESRCRRSCVPGRRKREIGGGSALVELGVQLFVRSNEEGAREDCAREGGGGETRTTSEVGDV